MRKIGRHKGQTTRKKCLIHILTSRFSQNVKLQSRAEQSRAEVVHYLIAVLLLSCEMILD